LQGEEGGEVEGSDAKREVLQLRRTRTAVDEPLADTAALVAGLLEMLAEDPGKAVVVDELPTQAEKLSRLGLERVGVLKVVAQMAIELLVAEPAEGGVDGDVESPASRPAIRFSSAPIRAATATVSASPAASAAELSSA
jgi:hypothetical protein